MKLSVTMYATVCAIAVGALTTANAQLRNEAQFAVGASYEMPAGDFSTGTGAPVRETPRRKEAGEHRLTVLKALAGSPADRGATLPQAGTVQQSSGRSVVTGASGGCKTNNATDYTPSDIHGAVGLTNLVAVTNVDIGVYSKSNCALISRVSLTTVFKAAFNIPSTQTLFDARVLYDPSVDRFLVIADSDDSNNTDQYQYFAVSQDGTGTSWYVYSFILSQGTSAFCKNDASDFWDYPSAGSSS